jgi:hypothetical protein
MSIVELPPPTAEEVAASLRSLLTTCNVRLVNDDDCVEIDHKIEQLLTMATAAKTQLSEESPPFKRGQRVRVNSPGRYHGEGIVQDDDRGRKPMVRVLLGNGNTWPYEVETVTLVDVGQWRYERERIVRAEG